ncbi:MAG: dihydroneopterin aldolase [Clostridiaceae bacterium]|jgi:dihydroneopterin aldolase|nr:dihydroneopterin aldolase [Clostridiaceae bacterium]
MKPAWTDQIRLEGLVFFGYVGVLAEEKQNGQEFEIDVTFHCRRLAATATDLLAQTIDYAQAYQAIRQIVETARFDLIERLAGAIADTLLQTYRLAMAVDVTVRKPHAPVPGRFAAMAVQIRRERS